MEFFKEDVIILQLLFAFGSRDFADHLFHIPRLGRMLCRFGNEKYSLLGVSQHLTPTREILSVVMNDVRGWQKRISPFSFLSLYPSCKKKKERTACELGFVI